MQVLFSEKQKLATWVYLLVYATVGGALVLMLWGIYQQVYLGEPWGSNPAPTYVLVIISTLLLLGLELFRSTQLYTRLDEGSFYYRYRPFHAQTYKIAWGELERAYVTEYRPLTELGGWGIRFSSKRGKAFTTSGNYGMQMIFKGGKKRFIGTHRPEALQAVLVELVEKGLLAACENEK